MVRTQISLTASHWNGLRMMAKQRNISVDELIRRAVETVYGYDIKNGNWKGVASSHFRVMRRRPDRRRRRRSRSNLQVVLLE